MTQRTTNSHESVAHLQSTVTGLKAELRNSRGAQETGPSQRRAWFKTCPIPDIDHSLDGSFALPPNDFTLEQLPTSAERDSRRQRAHMFIVRALHKVAG